MEPAARRLQAALADEAVHDLHCPVISNVEARANTDPLRVKELLVRQVVSPVRWQESIEELARLGCTTAVEVGPGKVLSGLVKRIAPSITCFGGDDHVALRELVEPRTPVGNP